MKFPLGQCVLTPGAQEALASAAASPWAYLNRHQNGDWGNVCEDDVAENEHALLYGNRLLSAYQLGDCRIWVITEADRSSTTILLPEEY